MASDIYKLETNSRNLWIRIPCSFHCPLRSGTKRNLQSFNWPAGDKSTPRRALSPYRGLQKYFFFARNTRHATGIALAPSLHHQQHPRRGCDRRWDCSWTLGIRYRESVLLNLICSPLPANLRSAMECRPDGKKAGEPLTVWPLDTKSRTDESDSRHFGDLWNPKEMQIRRP